MQATADSVPGSSGPSTTVPYVPTRPPGEKSARIRFRATGGADGAAAARPTPTPTATPIGVHEAAVFAAVAADLPESTTVLHSVVHTHQHFPPPPREEDGVLHGENASDTEGTGLVEELQRIAAETDRWRTERAQAMRSSTAAAEAQRAMESDMERRIFGKRVQEQDRALRRLTELCQTMERLGERGKGPVTGAVQPAAVSSGDEADAEARREAALRECMLASAWLAEKHAQGKREARRTCEREHLLGAQSIIHEEEAALRALLHNALDARARAQFADDESCFRAALQEREAVERDRIASAMLAIFGEADGFRIHESHHPEISNARAPRLHLRG